jgi:hypothetical protein
MDRLTNTELNERRTFFRKVSEELRHKILSLEREIMELTSRLVECGEKRKFMKETQRRHRLLDASIWELDQEFFVRERQRKAEAQRKYAEELRDGTRHGCGCLVRSNGDWKERLKQECDDCYYTYGDGAD